MNEVLGKDFFDSNFGCIGGRCSISTTGTAPLEMKRYLLRFIHHIDGQPNLTGNRSSGRGDFVKKPLRDAQAQVVPEHVVNFAFIGQFAETERDTIFTTEYSVRTAMEAVYTLLDVERAVPEVWGRCTTFAAGSNRLP
mgnify:CR=1 FL=1